MSIFDTTVIYGDLMAIEVVDPKYDIIRVKGQGQIYIKSILWIVPQNPLFFFMDGIHT